MSEGLGLGSLLMYVKSRNMLKLRKTELDRLGLGSLLKLVWGLYLCMLKVEIC